jgi:hypothetical protein
MKSRYPFSPGFKEDSTSLENAERLEESGRAATLRALVWQFFEAGVEDTADGIADRMGESILAIRPRVSELHKLGRIEQTGRRDKSATGSTSHVWRRREPQGRLAL